MVRAFTWSFGGDAIAEQALTEWAKNDAVTKTIRAAIAGRCTTQGATVTCAPAKGPVSSSRNRTAVGGGPRSSTAIEGRLDAS